MGVGAVYTNAMQRFVFFAESTEVGFLKVLFFFTSRAR
jgi:hypothetical protein